MMKRGGLTFAPLVTIYSRRHVPRGSAVKGMAEGFVAACHRQTGSKNLGPVEQRTKVPG